MSYHRPFNIVHNKYYDMEVAMLCQEAKLSHSTTVSNDVRHIYEELSKSVREYFQVSHPIFLAVL